MQSPIDASDFAKMLIILRFHHIMIKVPGYLTTTLRTGTRHKHITGHNKFPGSIHSLKFAWELLKTTHDKPQIGL